MASHRSARNGPAAPPVEPGCGVSWRRRSDPLREPPLWYRSGRHGRRPTSRHPRPVDGARPAGERPSLLDGPRPRRDPRGVSRVSRRGPHRGPGRPQGWGSQRPNPLGLCGGLRALRRSGLPPHGRPCDGVSPRVLLGRGSRRGLLDAGPPGAPGLRPEADLQPGLRPLRPRRAPPGHRESRGPRARGRALPHDRVPCRRLRARGLLGGPRARLGPARRPAAQREGPQLAEVDEHPPARHGGLHEPAEGLGR